jgi:hypothetical protein
MADQPIDFVARLAAPDISPLSAQMTQPGDFKPLLNFIFEGAAFRIVLSGRPSASSERET